MANNNGAWLHATTSSYNWPCTPFAFLSPIRYFIYLPSLPACLPPCLPAPSVPTPPPSLQPAESIDAFNAFEAERAHPLRKSPLVDQTVQLPHRATVFRIHRPARILRSIISFIVVSPLHAFVSCPNPNMHQMQQQKQHKQGPTVSIAEYWRSRDWLMHTDCMVFFMLWIRGIIHHTGYRDRGQGTGYRIQDTANEAGCSAIDDRAPRTGRVCTGHQAR